MLPVLLSSTPAPDGGLVLVWSVRPGRRVSVYVPEQDVTDTVLAAMLTVIIPALSERSTP